MKFTTSVVIVGCCLLTAHSACAQDKLTRDQLTSIFSEYSILQNLYNSRPYKARADSETYKNSLLIKFNEGVTSYSEGNMLFSNVERKIDTTINTKAMPFVIGKNSKYYFGIVPTNQADTFQLRFTALDRKDVSKTSLQYFEIFEKLQQNPLWAMTSLNIGVFQDSFTNALKLNSVDVLSAVKNDERQEITVMLRFKQESQSINAKCVFDLKKLGFPILLEHEIIEGDTYYTISESRAFVISDNSIETNSTSKIQQKHLTKGTTETNTVKGSTIMTFGDIPEYEFTLSAFGLPEPVGIEPIARPMNTLWYWLLGGAGFFAVVSVLLYRLKKRPEAKA
ncbi:MAG: hypothetical protein ACRCZF_09935 [Gemmataceae bacterium]